MSANTSRRIHRIHGNVTHPDDLRPAIAALSEAGAKKLRQLAAENGGDIQPWMIAKAADHERGESFE